MSDFTAPPLELLVLAHTHWDREWYLPAGRFRQRLVALVDELLDDTRRRPAGSDGAGSFLLDGQAVVLDDYLDVRPERRAELATALADGALEAGPWYVLADELMPSGEALVRNLLAGRRALTLLGAAAPPVLYCPDSFGHPAALPLIAAGFGHRAVVLWRGYGGRRWPAGDTARWVAPDGTEAVLYHLPPDGYEYGSHLPVDDAEARARWARVHEVVAQRARLGIALILNGADHHARQVGQQQAIEALARAAQPAPVRRVSLRSFARELAARADVAQLPEVRGELRDSYGYTWALQGTFASRAAQKRRNAQVERLLLREAEPWGALASISRRREGYQDIETPHAELTRAAWRTLLLCHPHDTLCGCSVDEVARAMDARLDDAVAQAIGVRDDALLAVLGHDRVAARERPRAWVRVLVVRNSAARTRGGVAELELVTKLHDVPVGPGSATRAPATARRRGAPVAASGLQLQLLDREVCHERIESPRHYPDDDLVEVARAVAWVPPIAGYGTTSFPLEERAPDPVGLPSNVPPVATGDAWLDNGLLRVAVSRSGDVALDAFDSSLSIPSLLRFEDVGDAGDLYTHSPVGGRVTSAWFLGSKVIHRGPLRGELVARWRMRLPASRAAEDDIEPGARAGRSATHVEITIAAHLTLDAGARFLRVRLSGANRARDHRLRALFATGRQSAVVRADAAFGPLTRTPIDVAAEDRAAETPPRSAPLHRYVTLHDGSGCVTLYSDGLAEYEATDDGDIAVTLVRAVGELSRNNLPERPGHAGWPAPVPDAQSLGPFEAAFALMPHGRLDAETIDGIERAADDVLLPLSGTTLRSALVLPAPTAGIELVGDGLAFSSAKVSEDGGALVLRCVNLRDHAVRGRWTLGAPVEAAWSSRLDEREGSPLPVLEGGVDFEAPARGVVTVLVRCRRPAG